MHTINITDVIFDAAKNVANLAKHGVPLVLAVELEWDELIAVPDTRRNYGEKRMVGYAPIGPRVYCVVFTDRGQKRRVISLRKANDREVRRYASEI